MCVILINDTFFLDDNIVEKPKKIRDYKKFPEGEGPPPDPAYNFLADSERDKSTQNGNKLDPKVINDKKDWRNKNESTNTRGGGGGRGGPGNGRGGRGGRNRGNGDRDGRSYHNGHKEYDAWKNERVRIDEERINRQKNSEGKWRREWDNDKLNSEGGDDDNTKQKLERSTLGDSFNALGITTTIKTTSPNSAPLSPKSPTNSNKNSNQSPKKDSHSQNQSQESQNQPRGNIMVSVSQNGEVKSVKCKKLPKMCYLLF